MKKTILAGLLLSITSLSSQADLINADWNTGDGLAVTDTVSNITWLDLSVTANQSVTDVQGLLSTTYAGWELATRAQVQDLMQNTFTNNVFDGNSYYGTYEAIPAASWRSTFGLTDGSSSYGLFVNGGQVAASGVHYNGRVVDNFGRSSDFSYNAQADGVFLVQSAVTPSVPLPASLGLLALAMCGFSFRRKTE